MSLRIAPRRTGNLCVATYGRKTKIIRAFQGKIISRERWGWWVGPGGKLVVPLSEFLSRCASHSRLLGITSLFLEMPIHAVLAHHKSRRRRAPSLDAGGRRSPHGPVGGLRRAAFWRKLGFPNLVRARAALANKVRLHRLEEWKREELKRTPFAILDEPPPELSPVKRPRPGLCDQPQDFVSDEGPRTKRSRK